MIRPMRNLKLKSTSFFLFKIFSINRYVLNKLMKSSAGDSRLNLGFLFMFNMPIAMVLIKDRSLICYLLFCVQMLFCAYSLFWYKDDLPVPNKLSFRQLILITLAYYTICLIPFVVLVLITPLE